MKRKLFSILIVLSVAFANAQVLNSGNLSVVTTAPSEYIHVCDQAREFTLKVKNEQPIGGSSQQANQIKVKVQMPTGMIFGSVTSPASGITATPNSSMNLVEFTGIPNLNPTESFTFKFLASASSDIIEVIRQLNPTNTNVSLGEFSNSTQVEYRLGVTAYTDVEPSGSNSYNVVFPVVNTILDPTTNNQIVSKYDLFSRKFVVKNGGFGKAKLIRLDLTYPNTLVQNTQLKFTRNSIVYTVAPSQTLNQVVTFLIDFAQLGISDLEYNEEILVTEFVRANECPSLVDVLQVNYKASAYCQANLISKDSTFSSVFLYRGNPSLTVSFEVLSQSNNPICSSSQFAAKTILTNVGSGNSPAQVNDALNARFTWHYTTFNASSGISGFKLFNHNSQQFVTIPNGVVASTLSTNNGCQSEFEYLISFKNHASVFNQDIDGTGGLDDLDGDGYFDDLAQGASIQVTADFSTSETSSTCNACASRFFYEATTQGYLDDACSGSSASNQAWKVAKKFELDVSSSSMNGTTDMFDGEIKDFEIDITGLYSNTLGLSCGNLFQNFSTQITMPKGFTLVPGSLVWNQGGNITSNLNYTYDLPTNTYTITGGGINGVYEFQVQLNCAVSTSNAATVFFNWNTQYTCGSCPQSRVLVCNSFEVFNHCPTCAGIHTTSLVAERTSMGWPLTGNNYTHNELRSVARLNYQTLTASQKEDLRLDRYMAYDTMLFVAQGGVYDNTSGVSYSNPYVELTYTSIFNFQALEVLDANFVVSGSQACTLSVVPVYSSSGSGSNIVSVYRFNLNACSGGVATLVDGDRFDLQVRFRINPLIDNNAYVGENVLTNFRVAHFATNNNAVLSSCNSIGARTSLIGNKFQGFGSIGYLAQCDNAAALITAGNGRPFGTEDYFRDEFRPWGALTQIRYDNVNRPDWFTSNDVLYDCYYGPQPNLLCGGVSIVPPANYTWDYNMWSVDDQSSTKLISIQVTPKCSLVTPSVFEATYQPYYYTLNNTLWNQTRVTGNVSVTNAPNFFTPNFNVTGSFIQEGRSREVKWPMLVCNNGGPAKHMWVSVEPDVTDITITGLEIQGSVILPRTYPLAGGKIGYMFDVADYGTTCISMNVIGIYTKCAIGEQDNLKFTVGYGCTSYPLTPTSSTCSRITSVKTLSLVYRQAGLQVTMNRLTNPQSATAAVCEEIEYEAVFNSSNIADMNDLVLRVRFDDNEISGINSNGVSYVSGSSISTYQTLDAGFPDPDFNSGTGYYEWRVSNFAPLSSNTPAGALPGIESGKNIFKIRFKVKTSCGFDPFLPLFVWDASGKTNCNQLISFAQRQEKIGIEGLDPVDQLNITVDAGNYDELNQKAMVTVTVTNTSDHKLYSVLPDVLRYMTVVLPYGFELKNPSAPVAKSGSFSVSQFLYSRQYWTLPDLNPGESFTIQFEVKKTGAECKGVVVYANTIMELPNVSCGAEVCEVRVTTDEDTDFIPLECCPPSVCVSPFNPIAGAEYVVSVWVKEENSLNATNYEKTSVSIYFAGVNQTVGPFKPSGNIIDGWQRIDAVFTVPLGMTALELRFNNTSNSGDAYFDDLRIHPFNSSFKAFVYDPQTLRLWSELDERNYATFYEYDQEGGLIRVKKETERGIMTITESRSNTVKK